MLARRQAHLVRASLIACAAALNETSHKTDGVFGMIEHGAFRASATPQR
jgi:hypothetical protein